MNRATVLATCAIVLAWAGAAASERWTTVHLAEGTQSWTLEASGTIELTPDGRDVLRMSPDAVLRVTSHGPSGELSLLVKADPDGWPVLDFANGSRRLHGTMLPEALRLAVVTYWASEPTERTRILQAAGGAVDLSHRDQAFREEWCRYHELESCEFARARGCRWTTRRRTWS